VVRGFKWLLVALTLIVAAGGATAAHASADPNALWTIVHDQCVPDQEASSDPAPCSLVDLKAGKRRGYAVLKDLVGATQFLVIPTDRISGIESPTLLEPDATNYFAAAWHASSFVDARAGVDIPRDWMSLAVNSAVARTQNQVHIHVDCVRADVRESLSRHIADVGSDWAPFPEPLTGHPYLAMAVEGEDLAPTIRSSSLRSKSTTWARRHSWWSERISGTDSRASSCWPVAPIRRRATAALARNYRTIRRARRLVGNGPNRT
jgi:CDP-diacylglycerol pyrophosphatase